MFEQAPLPAKRPKTPAPVLSWRGKEVEWKEHAREVNRSLNVGAWLAAQQPQKWEPPVGTSYDDLWDMDNIDTWG
jgi:hypothetical protein